MIVIDPSSAPYAGGNKMMTLDYSDQIKQLKSLQNKFNKAQTATERYAVLMGINHLIEEMKFTDEYWIKVWYDGMLRDQGVEVN